MAKTTAAAPDPTSEQADALEEAKAAFRAASEAENENRVEALDDLRFARLGEQWPERIRRERDLEGRPCLTINRLPAFIRQVVNDARQNKPAISVHPVDSGSDVETAEIYNGLIRHIEQSSDADVAYDTALDFAVSCGFGYFKINTRYARDDGFEQDIIVERVANPFAIYGDPNSTSADSSDWNRAFEISATTAKAFEERWPGQDPVSFDADGVRQTFVPDGEELVFYASDWKREAAKRSIIAVRPGAELPTPEQQTTLDGLLPEDQIIDLAIFEKNKALFDALGFTVVGSPREVSTYKVTQTLWSGAGELEQVPWAGKYIPIIPVYGEELNVEGRRILRSMVRDSKDPQRMFNYWRTASTELVALAPKAPFIGPLGAFASDIAKWNTANTETHAFIEYDTVDAEGRQITSPPQRQPFSGVPAGALQEALNASDDMKSIMGLHDASLGAKSNETSGRAIMARQREGDISTFAYIDNLSRAIRHAGRIMLDLIPKVYSTPRIVRVLGPDGQAKSVAVNKPTVVERKGENGQVEKIERIFQLDAGKYDLTVSAGPSFTSRREEAATQMIELIQAYPAAAPILGDLLARNLDWPGADEIAERLQALLPAQLQGQNPEMEQAKAQIQKLAEIIGQVKAENQALRADKSIKQGELEVKEYDAETKRLSALAGKDGVGLTMEDVMPAVVATLQHLANTPDLITDGTTQPAPMGGAAPVI